MAESNLAPDYTITEISSLWTEYPEEKQKTDFRKNILMEGLYFINCKSLILFLWDIKLTQIYYVKQKSNHQNPIQKT